MKNKKLERDISIHFEDLLTALNNNSLFYRILDKEGDEEKIINNWIEKKFPIQSHGCINWELVENSVVYHWSNWDEMRFSLKKILDSINDEPDNLVYIIWGNGYFPSFEINFNAMLLIGEIIIDEDFNVWVISIEKEWCIEKYHEGTLSFGCCDSPK